MTSRYSTLQAENLETMLSGGLELFYKKYNHLSRKINLQLLTPEVRFENLSFSVQVPAEAGAYGTVGSHLAQIFTPWQKIPMTTKHALHPMSGIIKPGSMTLILANPGAGKSTFLKTLAGKLQDNSQTEIGGEILYSGLKGEEIDLIKLSSIYKKTHEAIGKGFNEHQFENAEDFQKAKSVANLARSKEKSEFGLAFVPSTMLLLNRQKLVWLRDPPLLWGKLTEALIIGLVMGTIYFDVSSTYYLRMIFFTIALFQRQAWQQITISFQLRGVFYKQRPRNFFRTMSYAIAETVVQIPVNLSVAFILGTFFYFMSGLTRTFEKYIVFFLVLVCFQHAIGAYMTMLSSLSPSITGTEYVWFGIGILVAYYLFFTTLNGLALHFIRYEKYKGVSVKAMTDNAASEEDNVYVEVRTPGAGDVVQAKARGAGLPFTPSNLCIKDLEYYVTLPSGEEKQLLRGITAHFEPGRMVALMGATGAGKTTLMDVIAGRKTGGRIVGDIIVNGEQKNPANFSRITAYCE
ncbi:hypothetical protein PRNP1_012038 [Phytophthora ramorum]